MSAARSATLIGVCKKLACKETLAYSSVIIFDLFLPRDASAERGDATVSRLSVCPSVCP